jgi:hypothetical protein
MAAADSQARREYDASVEAAIDALTNGTCDDPDCGICYRRVSPAPTTHISFVEPDVQARQEIDAYLNNGVKLDILATADMAPDLAYRLRKMRETADELMAERDRAELASEEWEQLYSIAIGIVHEHRDDLREACAERDNWKELAFEEATLRGSVEASLFVAETRASEEAAEGARQTQLAQDRLQIISFLESAVLTYANHAWNDIKREIMRRWP